MFPRQKGWFSGGGGKPRNPHSLEHLKYLYTILSKNQTVTEHNKTLLVETLRSMSEMLIWGDQNDSSVFDFFLEKNMLSFFTTFMQQKTGVYICTQLLQTLNILFENIRNETSLYFLLSNNHINMIILHKFDFSDEEVMAYYISFLKSLSLKLNKHTVHFFYNEHTNDFALYTEAIKFFNHPENMVRIAVRTITLNVFRACLSPSLLDAHGRPVVEDETMLRYIRDKTAVPYFSNLVWFIGNHVLLLDTCVRHDTDHNSRDRLSDLVAEHLNHLHYLNDILSLHITALNDVLTDHLLNNLFLPLYVYSLTKRNKYMPSRGEKPHLSSVVSLFLLSQVFLIIQHAPVVRPLADIIFNCDLNMCVMDDLEPSHLPSRGKVCEFLRPAKLLTESFQSSRLAERRANHKSRRERVSGTEKPDTSQSTFYYSESESAAVADVTDSLKSVASSSTTQDASDGTVASENSTDEQKLLSAAFAQSKKVQADFSLDDRPYLREIFNTLDCSETDYETLFSLSLLYALGNNPGINQELLDTIFMPTNKSERKDYYNVVLVEKLIGIITQACQHGSRVRLATLEMSILLVKTLVYRQDECDLQDCHLAALEGAKEESTLLLRNFYKSEEIFLDMFEDEYRETKAHPVNVEYLTMDASILLPPTGTPLTGIEFNKRWPCGEVERARRAIRVFFLLRDLSLTLRGEREDQLPLTKHDECVHPGEILDLNNSDLIACVLVTKEGRKERYFLVIDTLQLILVEPEMRRLGWGVVTFVGYLQDVEMTGDKDDSRSLHITVHKPSASRRSHSAPLLSGRFVFDDHIRCMAAKQRLTKGRLKARQRKMQMIARLLEMPTPIIDALYQPGHSVRGGSAPVVARAAGSPFAASAIPGRSHPIQSQNMRRSKTVQPRRTTDRPSQLNESTPRTGPTRVSEDKCRDQLSGGERDIEEAHEVTAAPPEVQALQSLNQNQSGHRHMSWPQHKGQSGDTVTDIVDIQMDDLSKAVLRSTWRKTASRHLASVSAGGGRTRSSSHSPCSATRQRSARRYRSSNSSNRQLEAKSDGCGRAASCPSLHLLASCSNIDANRRPTFTVSCAATKRRPESIPKTLAPAPVAPLSLVSSCDATSATSRTEVGSPIKILLPAAFEKIHNLSESASSCSLTSSCANSDDLTLTRPVLNVGACTAVGESDVSAEGVSCVQRECSGTAIKQLNLLAQVMSKHRDDDGNTSVEDRMASEGQTSSL